MSVFFIIVSILIFCLKTHPNLRLPVIQNLTLTQFPANFSVAPLSTATTTASRRSSTSELSQHKWMLDKRKTEPHEAFFFIECVCNGWFTFELIIRFVVSPNKLAFMREPVNLIDLIATVSFYLDFILTYLKKENDVLEFFSIIRIMRLFKVRIIAQLVNVAVCRIFRRLGILIFFCFFCINVNSHAYEMYKQHCSCALRS